MATIVQTTEFQKSVLGSEAPVLVDFYADWCGPCRRLAPTIDKLANEYGDRVVKVNVDESPELAQEYQVSSIPTVIVFRGGQPVWRASGLPSVETLTEQLQE